MTLDKCWIHLAKTVPMKRKLCVVSHALFFVFVFSALYSLAYYKQLCDNTMK